VVPAYVPVTVSLSGFLDSVAFVYTHVILVYDSKDDESDKNTSKIPGEHVFQQLRSSHR